ncbi:5'-AMP-activated protein kinase, regulatory gamma subunit, partial [Phenoliferia sp. Uapishka_3]
MSEIALIVFPSIPEIEQAIDVPPPPTIFVHPDQPLADACAALVRTHARRLPLVDRDDQTGKETIVSVLTQYRVLKFIAINCSHDCARLDQSIGSLGIGSYVSWYDGGRSVKTSSSSSPHNSPNPNLATPNPTPTRLSSSPAASSRSRSRSVSGNKTFGGQSGGHDGATPASTLGGGEDGAGVEDRYFPLATATLETSVFDVVHIFSERGISAVPIVDEDGVVLNMYETVDIVDLVRQNAYQVLDKTISIALQQRSPDFNGVITCTPSDTLASILEYIRERRCHRFVIIEPEDVEASEGRPRRKKGALVGILSLSDVLRYLVGHENLKGLEVEGLGTSAFPRK